MKIKTSGHSNTVVLETNARDSGLPPVPLPELCLKKILAPVDFSPCSRKALEYAVLFARQFNAELVVLHVNETAPPQVAVLEGALMDTTFRQDSVAQLVEWQTALASGVTARAVIRDGSVAYKEIVAAAEESDTDLIVVGNQGRKGLARAYMGSTAERVVQHAPCPVLVIRNREHEFIIEPEGSAPPLDR